MLFFGFAIHALFSDLLFTMRFLIFLYAVRFLICYSLAIFDFAIHGAISVFPILIVVPDFLFTRSF